MKLLYTFLLVGCLSLVASAQTRYVDSVFTVGVTTDVVYGNNISVLTGSPAPTDLLTNVYMPMDDDSTNRPAVVLMHTGSFLPPLTNGGITGARSDSAVVEISRRLASRGYVVFAATYRAGWNPLGDQNERTGTLLNAAYRGGQDTHTALRWLKRGVAEMGNPYGIDTMKLVVWGLGTGGYNVHTAAYLDRFEELNEDKWISSQTGNIYVNEGLSGDPKGLSAATLNTPNHVGYTSNFQLGVNMGGALGDTSWVEGTDDEPALIGLHSVSDPFAPFGNGPVIVPTTREFVVNVHGSNPAVREANDNGGNAALSIANDPDSLRADVYGPLAVAVAARNQAYQQQTITFLGEQIPLSRPNMYPFILPGLQAGPWDWYNEDQVRATVAAVNQARGTSFNADTLLANGRLTNPDISRMKAMAYIDTTMAFFLPRACEVLNLPCAPSITVSTREFVTPASVALDLFPNPAGDMGFTVRVAETLRIRQLDLFDINGRNVRQMTGLEQSSIQVDRGNLPRGQYIVRLRLDDGVTARMVTLE
jgi:hypothetical protein